MAAEAWLQGHRGPAQQSGVRSITRFVALWMARGQWPAAARPPCGKSLQSFWCRFMRQPQPLSRGGSIGGASEAGRRRRTGGSGGLGAVARPAAETEQLTIATVTAAGGRWRPSLSEEGGTAESIVRVSPAPSSSVPHHHGGGNGVLGKTCPSATAPCRPTGLACAASPTGPRRADPAIAVVMGTNCVTPHPFPIPLTSTSSMQLHRSGSSSSSSRSSSISSSKARGSSSSSSSVGDELLVPGEVTSAPLAPSGVAPPAGQDSPRPLPWPSPAFSPAEWARRLTQGRAGQRLLGTRARPSSTRPGRR